MFASTDRRRLAAISDVVARHSRGVHKRIDENRELLEYLQLTAPQLLHSHPWVVRWIQSQDEFLCELLRVVETPNPNARSQPAFPRPWPATAPHPIPRTAVQDITSLAGAIERRMNAAYWHELLAAVQEALRHEGYECVRGSEASPMPWHEIPEGVRTRVGRAVVTRRLLHVAPLSKPDAVRSYVDSCQEDGYAVRWADGILSSLAELGCTFARISENHALEA